MRLDWTISVWQVAAVCWFGFLFFFTVVRKLDKLIATFEEYPPHKHIAGIGEPLYPKGMKPNGD